MRVTRPIICIGDRSWIFTWAHAGSPVARGEKAQIGMSSVGECDHDGIRRLSFLLTDYLYVEVAKRPFAGVVRGYFAVAVTRVDRCRRRRHTARAMRSVRCDGAHTNAGGIG